MHNNPHVADYTEIRRRQVLLVRYQCHSTSTALCKHPKGDSALPLHYLDELGHLHVVGLSDLLHSHRLHPLPEGLVHCAKAAAAQQVGLAVGQGQDLNVLSIHHPARQ